MDTPTEWPSEWLRGVLTPCVLRILAENPTYGYVIAQLLSTAGLGTIKGGTLYPLLGRLEKDGLVSVNWRPGDGGPGRKYYALTPEGARRLEETIGDWGHFSRAVSALLDAEPLDRGPHTTKGTREHSTK